MFLPETLKNIMWSLINSEVVKMNGFTFYEHTDFLSENGYSFSENIITEMYSNTTLLACS